MNFKIYYCLFLFQLKLRQRNIDTKLNLRDDFLYDVNFINFYVSEFLNQYEVNSFDNIKFVNTVNGYTVIFESYFLVVYRDFKSHFICKQYQVIFEQAFSLFPFYYRYSFKKSKLQNEIIFELETLQL